MKNADKTRCIRGHPLSGDNLRIDKRGRRNCKACEIERQRERRARSRPPGPPRRSRGEQLAFAKLTETDVLEIRAAYHGRADPPQRELAERYGVDQRTISNILLRKTWAHVQPGRPSGVRVTLPPVKSPAATAVGVQSRSPRISLTREGAVAARGNDALFDITHEGGVIGHEEEGRKPS